MVRIGLNPFGFLAAALAAACCAGCAGDARPTVAPADDTITPVVRGAEAGLEARLWVVENRAGMLAAAMRDFGAPAGASEASIELWRANGLRVLEVPLDRLEMVRNSLVTIGPLHREWLGLLPEWVEVVKGARLDSERTVALDNGPVRLGPGRLRLLARCWAQPRVGAQPEGMPTGALLRLELVPELASRAADPEPLGRLLGNSSVGGLGTLGMTFDRLRLGLASTGDSAIVIVPEDPGVDWGAQAPGRPESGVDARRGGVTFGPRAPVAPTLGELMLTSLALPESVGDARVIVVLSPRVPDHFELLPR